jgi:hypothetical protein
LLQEITSRADPGCRPRIRAVRIGALQGGLSRRRRSLSKPHDDLPADFAVRQKPTTTS